MSELSEKPVVLKGYEYHLPDKPFPARKNGKISYEDFFEWVDEDTHAEWVDGEIDMSSPVGNRHQQLVLFFSEILKRYVAIYGLGEVRLAMQMKLPSSGREPDVFFVAKANLHRLLPTRLQGPADLTIEVVSPEKRDQERDRVTKVEEYAAGQVPEYWLVDYTKNEAIFYRLDAQGKYQAMALDDEGKYQSQVLKGFWLKPEWLWRKRLPEVDRVLKTIAGADYVTFLTRQLEAKEEL